ncbi:MAG: hypothetical protein S4CHLAM20_14720 [Chlamydiia bacterium]|nr:hypothetical protein [Chlamydiia bacterium]
MEAPSSIVPSNMKNPVIPTEMARRVMNPTLTPALRSKPSSRRQAIRVTTDRAHRITLIMLNRTWFLITFSRKSMIRPPRAKMVRPTVRPSKIGFMELSTTSLLSKIKTEAAIKPASRIVYAPFFINMAMNLSLLGKIEKIEFCVKNGHSK